MQYLTLYQTNQVVMTQKLCATSFPQVEFFYEAKNKTSH